MLDVSVVGAPAVGSTAGASVGSGRGLVVGAAVGSATGAAASVAASDAGAPDEGVLWQPDSMSQANVNTTNSWSSEQTEKRRTLQLQAFIEISH